ncbi:hypothetical protein JZ751_009670, partial [Albula glossodonta]
MRDVLSALLTPVEFLGKGVQGGAQSSSAWALLSPCRPQHAQNGGVGQQPTPTVLEVTGTPINQQLAVYLAGNSARKKERGNVETEVETDQTPWWNPKKQLAVRSPPSCYTLR